MNNPIYIVISMVINCSIALLFARFMLQWAQIPESDPYMKLIKRLTCVTDVYHKILPNVGKAGQISLVALVWMLLLFWAKEAIGAYLLHKDINALQLLFLGTMTAISNFLELLRMIVFGGVIVSLMTLLVKTSPKIIRGAELLMRVSQPIMNPFRKITPPLGMLDLTPMIAILVLTLLQETIWLLSRYIWTSL